MVHTDIICAQESHLIIDQERSFRLYAQSCDFFFSHGLSQSAGVWVAVRCNIGVMAVKFSEMQGWLLALDLNFASNNLHLINLYAPNDKSKCQDLFAALPSLFTSHTVLIGDFNSVVNVGDRVSQTLDPTSTQLKSLLQCFGFVEPRGSHLFSFSYQHPSISSKKSCLNRIYFNYSEPSIHGFTQYMSFSDHYLVGTYRLPCEDIGPKP